MIASYPRLRRTRAAWLPMYPAPPTTSTAKVLSCTTQDIIIEALGFGSIPAMAGINSRTMESRRAREACATSPCSPRLDGQPPGCKGLWQEYAWKKEVGDFEPVIP